MAFYAVEASRILSGSFGYPDTDLGFIRIMRLQLSFVEKIFVLKTFTRDLSERKLYNKIIEKSEFISASSKTNHARLFRADYNY